MSTNVQSGPIEHRIGEQGDLRLRTVSGTVRVRATDGQDARVVARHTSAGDEPELIVRRYEGGLSIEPQRRGTNILGATIGIGLPDIDFEVELPHAARLELNAVSADVSCLGLDGEQDYKLVSGDLDLRDAGGRLTAKSVSGDMSLATTSAIELEATTTSGDVELSGERLEHVRVRSVSGDVLLSGGLAAGPDHRVETVSGDLRLEPTTGVTIHASGPVIDLTSDLAGRLSSRRGERELVIGDGAASLRFRSMSGEVHVSEGGRPVRRAAPAEPPAEEPLHGPSHKPAADETDSLEVLRALERGEIDVEEASRRLSAEAGDA